MIRLENQQKINVTVVTGFLGAGKTTVINNLLKKYPEKRFALVENEFGPVAIDTKLIRGMDASRMFELKNGCICCTISNEYELVLQELATRYKDIEHLLIETTGLADPVPVILPFLRDESLKELYHFNGTLCVVDGQNLEFHEIRDLAVRQIAVSDLVMLNKTENLEPAPLSEIEKMVTSVNPFCGILPVSFGNCQFLNIDQIIVQKKIFPLQGDHFTKQLQGIEAKTIVIEVPPDREEFTERLQYVLDIHRGFIYRIKGFVYFKNDPVEYVIQGVGNGFELAENGMSQGRKKSEIVLIMKNSGNILNDLSF